MLLSSTVRELPGKSPKTSGEVRGTSGEVRGLPRSSGEPDSLPATRQICLQLQNKGLLAPGSELLRHALESLEQKNGPRRTCGGMIGFIVTGFRLGCHFSRDDFRGIFGFFDFSRLPSKLAMNLVVSSLSLMCIFLPAF